MKKYISLTFVLSLVCGCKTAPTMFIVPTAKQVQMISPYKRIVIFGVDGAGGAFLNANTPNFDRIFSNGSINYNGQAQIPTISAENWSSMFYGVTAETHGKTTDIICNNPHNDQKFPSVIKTYSLKYSESTFCSIVNWAPINDGIFESIDNLSKISITKIFQGFSDYQIDEKVSEYAIKRLEEYDDTITFLHFGNVDYCGHKFGSSSKEYLDSIEQVDTLIGNIYDKYLAYNRIDSTLFICISDHGHRPTGGHGGDSELEKTVTFAASDGGKNIIKGTTDVFYTHYLASVILYALGEKQPKHYEGGVPNNLFSTLR